MLFRPAVPRHGSHGQARLHFRKFAFDTGGTVIVRRFVRAPFHQVVEQARQTGAEQNERPDGE